jgi:hypothetical protein
VVPSIGASLPHRIDRAFTELDRQGRGRNGVSLAPIRMVLGNVSRGTFGRELRDLWKAGRYTLVAVEDP